MKPEQHSQPQQNYEKASSALGESDYSLQHENTTENRTEREQNMPQVEKENAPTASLVASTPQATQTLHVPVPVPQKPTTDSAGPTIANDDDLIEKEWVNKAKDIIAKTQDNPYQREKEVSQLQVDYLRKRYGKELGT